MRKRCGKYSRPRLHDTGLTPRNRSGIISDYLPWLLIALVILAIVMVSIFFLKGTGIEFIDKIKNFFRGG